MDKKIIYLELLRKYKEMCDEKKIKLDEETIEYLNRKIKGD